MDGMYEGGCQCGAIRYQLAGKPTDVALCHCVGCRRSSGAPVMAWAGFAEDCVKVTKGNPKTINSSGATIRSFCGDCGTGLFYRNADLLPGIVEVQLATFDNPDAVEPTAQVQAADQIGWMKRAHELPSFEGFAG